MTRGEITAVAMDFMGERMGTPGAADYQAWHRTISEAANRIAEVTRCLYKMTTTPVLAYTAEYKLPGLLSINAGGIYTPDGVWHLLDDATIQAMDDWSSGWRSAQAGPQPDTLITAGRNLAILYPAPNYASTVAAYTDLVATIGGGGLLLSSAIRPFVNAVAPAGDINLFLQMPGGAGFTQGTYQIQAINDDGNAVLLTPAGIDGSTAGVATLMSGGLWMEGDGIPGASWENDTDICPLPEPHFAVVWQACIFRAVRDPSAANMKRRQMCMEDLNESLGLLEHEGRRFTKATREPSLVGDSGGPLHAFSPLNL